MKSALALLIAMLMAASAFAEEVQVEIEAAKTYKFRLNSGGSELFYTAHVYHDAHMTSSGSGYSTLQEYYADDVTEAEAVSYREKIFAKVFESGVYTNEQAIKLERMSSKPFVCELIRYASASEEWAKILKRLGNKPVGYFEATPQPFDRELGDFIRKAGLVQDIEKAFDRHGYHLKWIAVGGVFTERVKKLTKQQQKCLAGEPVVSIVPGGAVLYFLFDAAEPKKVDPEGKNIN